MTPWGLVVVALAGIAAPFFIAPLLDRSHPAFTPLGLALGLGLSLAFGAWRLVDTLSRLDSVETSPHGFAFRAALVAGFTLGAVAVAGIILMFGVVLGALLGRWLDKPTS